MKQIIIVRHAKSSWEFDVSDKERPLKNRGITDVGLVSKAFLAQGVLPEKVFSSSATRALETCKIFIKTMNIDFDNVGIYDQLYDFEGYNVLDFIKSIDNKYNNVMLFGHNYALTAIVNKYGDRDIDNLPTCGLAVIEFDIDNWQDLNSGKTKLVLVPKQFKT